MRANEGPFCSGSAPVGIGIHAYRAPKTWNVELDWKVEVGASWKVEQGENVNWLMVKSKKCLIREISKLADVSSLIRLISLSVLSVLSTLSTPEVYSHSWPWTIQKYTALVWNYKYIIVCEIDF